jgi:simple sugar transport system permease protein
MGLFNIGVDGQYRLAAVIAAAAGAAVDMPAPLHVAFILIVAMAVGCAWASVPAALKVTRGVNEVISTIMMNFVATGLAAYLLQNHFKVPDDPISKTELIDESGRIGTLDWLLDWFGIDLPNGSHLQGFLVIAIVLGVAFHLLITRTVFGFELSATGINPTAAGIGGVATRRMTVRTLLLSGAIAGLVGMAPLLNEFHRYAESGFPTQLAFTGIAVALLGGNHPVGIAIAAFVFAFIERGSVALDNLSVPTEISRIMQGSLILAGVIGYEVVRRRSVAAKTSAVAAISPSSHPSSPSSGTEVVPT